jgi:hypothetical protein
MIKSVDSAAGPLRKRHAHLSIQSSAALGHKMPSAEDHSDDACAAKVTSLLNEAGAGSSRASADLLPLVYEQLRALAGRKM